MGKQLEPGKQTPLRPTIATLDLASAFTLPEDAPAVDWTAAGTRLPIQLATKLMDDRTILADGGSFLDVRPGIWRLCAQVHIVNDGAIGAEDFRIALTNGDGSTVHLESNSVEVPSGSDMTLQVSAIVHVQSLGEDLCIRGANTTGGGSALDVQPAHVGYIELIGNVNET